MKPPDARLPRRSFVGGALASLTGVGCSASLGLDAPAGAASREPPRGDPFVRVEGMRLVLGGRPLYVMGCNYWSAAADSRTEAGRQRVRRELGRLQAIGVRVLRIMALSEGPDSEPWRIRPSLQPAPGRFTSDGLAGLDWLMAELAARDMFGVFTLNNFWFWSGGMPQYLSWARGVTIPYPNPDGGGDWDGFQDFAAQFFSDNAARALFEHTLEAVIPRYRESRAVFAWELVNEPHGRRNVAAYRTWLDVTARFVKNLDPNHLITTGSEGDTLEPELNGVDTRLDHQSPAIDVVSFHLWPENWGWSHSRLPGGFDGVTSRARAYVDAHVETATRLGKPALLLEAGLPRDGGAFEPSAPVHERDRFFELMFQATLENMEAGGVLAGVFPWAWSGEALPERPGVVAAQVPSLGDPPHERQGWYGIYASDVSTVELMTRYAARFARG